MEDPYYVPPCCDSKAENAKLRTELKDMDDQRKDMIRQKFTLIQERDASLLQIGEVGLAWTELKAAEAANVPSGEFGEDDLRGDRVRVAKDKLNLALDGIIEKPLQEPPKKCNSYWDGNQCEDILNHDGKHRFMGWTWVVSPPPMLCGPCSAHGRNKDAGCTCECHLPEPLEKRVDEAPKPCPICNVVPYCHHRDK